MMSITQKDRSETTPGELTELLTFQVEARVSDDGGGYTRSWSDAGQAWAKAEFVQAAEGSTQGAQRNVQQVRFTMYRDEVLHEQMRIMWEGEVYAILEIEPGPARHLFMTVLAETGAGE
ncbi:MAG: head-tail adaptor protein [Pseudomonadota bacterium]